MKELLDLIKRGDINAISSILYKDPKKMEEADDKGMTPAMASAASGNFELLKYVIEYTFASMNIWDKKHQSMLHYAAMGNCRESFAYLVERVSLNPLEVSLNFQTPLDIAVKYNSDNIISYYRDELGIEEGSLYKNPVLAGANPDPSIIRVEDDYYMVTSSFVFFPSIPVYHSRDLVNWEVIGHGVIDNSYIDLSEMDDGRGFWAPDISYNKGNFFITATLRCNDSENIRRKQMVVWSEKPEGPYSKPTYIEEDGIDPSIFTDDDGRRYMLLNRGARIFEISEYGDKKISDASLLWYGSQKRAPEAPHLLKKDGFYYVFVAEGGTGPNHQISVARSENLLGPYRECPYNPILIQRDPNHPIQRSGHGKLVKTAEDKWFIVYLCSRMVNGRYSILGRETALDHVEWSNDGWPIINGNRGPSGASIRPSINKVDKEHNKIRYNGLPPEFVFIRNPQDSFFSYDSETEDITLIGGMYDLSSKKTRNLLVKRQPCLVCSASATLHISSDQKEGEVGLTCFYDNSAYLKFFVSDSEGMRELNVVQHFGDREEKFSIDLEFQNEIELKIHSDYLKRSLFYRFKGSEWVKFRELKNTYYLSDEGIPGKKFTGTMIGIYALDFTGSNSVKSVFRNFKLEL